MPVKLTKTARTLLEQAASKKSGRLYAMVWHSTSAKGTHGRRAAGAIRFLVEKGLASDLKVESNHGPNSDGWGSTFADEYQARITDAGRAALES